MERNYAAISLKNYLDQIPPGNRAKVNDFDQENELRDLALGTRVTYAKVLASFTNFVDRPFSKVTRDDVRSWLSSLPYKPRVVNLYKSCIKRFFKWLMDPDDMVYPAPVKWIKYAKINDEEWDLVTKDDIDKLVAACRESWGDLRIGARDTAMITVHFEAGTRPGELIYEDPDTQKPIKIRNVNCDQHGMVLSVNGKTGRRKIRLIKSVPYLQAWLDIHPGKDDPDAPLWLTAQGSGMGESNFRRKLNRLIKKAGIDKRIWPHLFRHARATGDAEFLTDAEMRVRHGWTAKSNMPGRYTHLQQKGVDRKVLAQHGIASSNPDRKDLVAQLREENEALKARLSRLEGQTRTVDQEKVRS